MVWFADTAEDVFGLARSWVVARSGIAPAANHAVRVPDFEILRVRGNLLQPQLVLVHSDYP